MTIAPNVLLLVAETNSSESSEFLSAFLFTPASMSCYQHAAIFIVLIFFLEWLRTKTKALMGVKWVRYLAVLFVLFILSGIPRVISVYHKAFNSKTIDELSTKVGGFGSFPGDPLSRLALSVYGMTLAGEEMPRALHATYTASQNPIAIEGRDSLNIIFVIGESYIKSHSSLYGYPLQTTPIMQKEKAAGRLFAFTDVVTPYNLTSLSLRNMFCTNSVGAGESWYDYPFFPTLVRKAGYDVYFWDNQKNFDPAAMFSYALNSFLYNAEIADASYTQSNEESFHYDADIVVDFKKKVTLTSPLNFMMFHLIGQHVLFSDRYPHSSKWNRFTTDSIQRNESWLSESKKQEIVDYDNATYYNDYVLGMLMDMLCNQPTVLVYLADHGEEVYDYRDSKGRVRSAYTADLVHFQYDIPFIVWCSESFKARYPELMALIAAAVDRPFQIDDVAHLLFHLAGIHTDFYRADRDLISPTYVCDRRMVEDTTEYESWR